MDNTELEAYQAELMRQLVHDMQEVEPQSAETDVRLIMQFVMARQQLHLTQHQLAVACGLPQSAIARFESGKSSPTLRTLQRITSALNKKLMLKDIA